MLSSKTIDQISNLSHFNESGILNAKGQIVGFSTVAIDRNGNAIGGGIHKDKNTSKRICIAESLERSSFKEICKDSSLKNQFLIDLYPTTCGFAAGFDSEKTKLRAVCEAVERWLWSKWIDEGYIINQIENINLKSEIAEALSAYFDDKILFHKNIQIKFENKILELQCGIFLGFKNDGIFPGSRVCSMNENPWEHAVIESWRHWHISNEHKDNIFQEDIFIKRINFFSKNTKIALKAINSSKNTDWPSFKLDFCNNLESSNFYLWRALTFDFISWDKGQTERFVY